jgi:hypothetical protein
VPRLVAHSVSSSSTSKYTLVVSQKMRSTSARKRSAVRKKISRSMASMWGIEEIQRKVQVVQRQRGGLRKVGSLRHPVLIAGQLGQGLGQAVRHHREERQFMGRTTGSTRLQVPQDLANAQFLPQRPGHVDDTQRLGPLNVEGLSGWADLWRDVDAALTYATDALGEAQKHFAI